MLNCSIFESIIYEGQMQCYGEWIWGCVSVSEGPSKELTSFATRYSLLQGHGIWTWHFGTPLDLRNVPTNVNENLPTGRIKINGLTAMIFNTKSGILGTNFWNVLGCINEKWFIPFYEYCDFVIHITIFCLCHQNVFCIRVWIFQLKNVRIFSLMFWRRGQYFTIHLQGWRYTIWTRD